MARSRFSRLRQPSAPTEIREPIPTNWCGSPTCSRRRPCHPAVKAGGLSRPSALHRPARSTEELPSLLKITNWVAVLTRAGPEKSGPDLLWVAIQIIGGDLLLVHA